MSRQVRSVRFLGACEYTDYWWVTFEMNRSDGSESCRQSSSSWTCFGAVGWGRCRSLWASCGRGFPKARGVRTAWDEWASGAEAWHLGKGLTRVVFGIWRGRSWRTWWLSSDGERGSDQAAECIKRCPMTRNLTVCPSIPHGWYSILLDLCRLVLWEKSHLQTTTKTGREFRPKMSYLDSLAGSWWNHWELLRLKWGNPQGWWELSSLTPHPWKQTSLVWCRAQ